MYMHIIFQHVQWTCYTYNYIILFLLQSYPVIELEVGDSVIVEATCRADGVEVTWNGLNDEVDLVQIEYTCRNVTAEDNVSVYWIKATTAR